jgi:hypothetical protein
MGAVLLEALDAAFDHVATPIGDPVEPWWAATGPAATVSVGLLVGRHGGVGRQAKRWHSQARAFG